MLILHPSKSSLNAESLWINANESLETWERKWAWWGWIDRYILITTSIYDECSWGPSMWPICTRCCFAMTIMIQVCNRFDWAGVFYHKYSSGCDWLPQRLQGPSPSQHVQRCWGIFSGSQGQSLAKTRIRPWLSWMFRLCSTAACFCSARHFFFRALPAAERGGGASDYARANPGLLSPGSIEMTTHLGHISHSKTAYGFKLVEQMDPSEGGRQLERFYWLSYRRWLQ